MHTVDWNDQLPWGVEVNLTQYISLDLAGIEKVKRAHGANGKNKGVVLKSPTSQELEKLTALFLRLIYGLVRPDREAGRAFLVSNNFRTILDWNKSTILR